MTDTPAPFSPAPPHVSLVDIRKSFGSTEVLHGVSMSVPRGTVHGLVGENGAGKSSLSKVVAGLLTADAGQLVVDGEQQTFRSPREALAKGIASIAQELALVPSLTVAQNVFLGQEPRRGPFLSSRTLRRRFIDLAGEVGFDLDPDALTGALRTADQQKVEILKALSRGARFIIMDEPTAALAREDTERLHAIIRQLADSGRTVLLISHFLSEVLSLTDDVTILRDGSLVRSGPTAAETEATLIEGMLGRKLSALFPPKTPAPDSAEAVLAVDGLRAPGVHGVSLQVRAGEILGLAGLVGAGRSEIVHGIFGSARRLGGSVRVAGAALRRSSPVEALRRGVFLLPESRKEQGLLLQRPIRENVTLASLRDFSVASWITGRAERVTARRALEDVTVKAESAAPVSSLSGGNQQKVMFGRGILSRPKVLIADEPTRGVDVGSRRAIYDLLVEQARAGVAVIVISSDVDEVLGLAHRVLVIRHGRISAELEGAAMTEENVLVAAFAERRDEESPDSSGGSADSNQKVSA